MCRPWESTLRHVLSVSRAESLRFLELVKRFRGLPELWTVGLELRLVWTTLGPNARPDMVSGLVLGHDGVLEGDGSKVLLSVVYPKFRICTCVRCHTYGNVAPPCGPRLLLFSIGQTRTVGSTRLFLALVEGSETFHALAYCVEEFYTFNLVRPCPLDQITVGSFATWWKEGGRDLMDECLPPYNQPRYFEFEVEPKLLLELLHHLNLSTAMDGESIWTLPDSCRVALSQEHKKLLRGARVTIEEPVGVPVSADAR